MDIVRQAIADLANSNSTAIVRRDVMTITNLIVTLSGEITKSIQFLDRSEVNPDYQHDEVGNQFELCNVDWIMIVLDGDEFGDIPEKLSSLVRELKMTAALISHLELEPIVKRLEAFELDAEKLQIDWVLTGENWVIVKHLGSQQPPGGWIKLPKLPGESVDSYIKSPSPPEE